MRVVDAGDPLILELEEPVPPTLRTAPAGAGLAISFATARRARLNGDLTATSTGVRLTSTETFTLCKKYVAPSLARPTTRQVGPSAQEPAALDDPTVGAWLARAETAFLASQGPEGAPDVAHRGGPPGFLRLDPIHRRLAWDEFVGDGVFKSAGNIRATSRLTLVVPDLSTRDALEVRGSGIYTTVRAESHERADALVQHAQDYPGQGHVECQVIGLSGCANGCRPANAWSARSRSRQGQPWRIRLRPDPAGA